MKDEQDQNPSSPLEAQADLARALASVIRSVERDILQRQCGARLDEAMLADIAGRLGVLAAKMRALDTGLLKDVPPAITYQVPCQAGTGGVPASQWQALAGPGGTGYASLETTARTGALAAAKRPGPPVFHTGSQDLVPPVHADDPLAGRGAKELADLIRRGEVSPVDAVQAALDRIGALDGSVRAWVTVWGEKAIEEAEASQEAIARGEPLGPLHGVPVGVKDIFEITGLVTTAGSQVLAGHVSRLTAAAVERLQAAGAIVIGKTATHEFAFGVTTDTPFHGPVHNPWALDRVPGGSSGGSGAAVASRMVPAALGTDTGGSVRIPASLCGTVGLKPTFGMISKYGVIPLAWSQDHVGVLASTVEDAALFLGVLAGPDPRDPSTLTELPGGFLQALDQLAGPANEAGATAGAGLDGSLPAMVAVPFDWLADGEVDEGILAAFQSLLGRLEAAGVRVQDAKLPPARAMAVVNRFISLCEGASYHADTLLERPGDFSAAVRSRFELGQFLLAKDYITMQRLRGELARLVSESLRNTGATVMLLPTTPVPAPRIGQEIWSWPGGPEAVPDTLIRFTAPFSLTGHPVVTVPAGLVAAPDDGALLPWGLQVVGRPLDDAVVLAQAQAIVRSVLS